MYVKKKREEMLVLNKYFFSIQFIQTGQICIDHGGRSSFVKSGEKIGGRFVIHRYDKEYVDGGHNAEYLL